MAIGIVLSLIDFACRHAVTKHFFHKTQRHFDRFVHFCGGVDIVPIFKMVAVSPLVVHPRIGTAEEFAFALVGTSRALIIARAGDELGGRILGEVVKKSLPADACAEAMPNDAMAVSCDGSKM